MLPWCALFTSRWRTENIHLVLDLLSSYKTRSVTVESAHTFKSRTNPLQGSLCIGIQISHVNKAQDLLIQLLLHIKQMGSAQF